MKKIVFCIITVGVLYFNANAQLSQGSISVGGSFNLWLGNSKTEYTNQTVDGPKTTHFTLLPSVEYFFADELSVGLGIGYDLTKSNDVGATSTTTDKTGIFRFEPYVRKYFKVGDRFSFYGQGGFSLGFGKRTIETTSGNISNTDKYAQNSFSIGITPGISYLVSDKVALEASFGFLGYSGQSQEISATTKSKSSNFGLQLNPSTLNFGIRFFIK